MQIFYFFKILIQLLVMVVELAAITIMVLTLDDIKTQAEEKQL